MNLLPRRLNSFASGIVLFMLISSSANAQQTGLPQLGHSPVKAVIAAMTPTEKVNLVLGTGMKMQGMPAAMQGPVVGTTDDKVPGAAGTTYAIPRLGIPSIVVADGPAGLRIKPFRGTDSLTSYYCTAFPIGTLLASSWDTSLVRMVGHAMGNEVKEYGVDILLGPALNNHRNPLGGRNFEYYSEDPLVSGWIAAAYINGVQSAGVGTSIKHFALNNHEWNRNTINVVASQRAIREIYLRSFQLAIRESRPWTVMSSYNKINGTYASENHALLTTILRDEWKYKGFVMTDWFGGQDAVAQMKAGNDLLMPGTALQQEALTKALGSKDLKESVLDANVEHILNIILLSPAFKKYPFSNKPDLIGNAAVARMAASEGMILLKNDGGTLPMRASSKVAVFGQTSYAMITGGTGSGDVNEAYTVSLIEGLNRDGFVLNPGLEKMYGDYLHEQSGKRPKPASSFFLPAPIPELSMPDSMIRVAAGVLDYGIITIGRNAGEFADRKIEDDYELSTTEKKLIKDVSAIFHAQQKKVIVILNIGGVIETGSWSADPDAILLAWQPGQEAGIAVADILVGKVNPSGKLATTFPVRYTDVPSSKDFPGVVLVPKDSSDHSPFSGAKSAEIKYEEGIYTGYRYADKANQSTSYEFGFGLSYTSFDLGNLGNPAEMKGDRIRITTSVKNSGKVAGKEVVQLYIAAPGKTLDKPLRELKGFVKTRLLKPGESQQVSFTVDRSMLASFDPAQSAWVIEAGTYELFIGNSSRKLPLHASFTVAKGGVTEKVNDVLQPPAGFETMRLK